MFFFVFFFNNFFLVFMFLFLSDKNIKRYVKHQTIRSSVVGFTITQETIECRLLCYILLTITQSCTGQVCTDPLVVHPALHQLRAAVCCRRQSHPYRMPHIINTLPSPVNWARERLPCNHRLGMGPYEAGLKCSVFDVL